MAESDWALLTNSLPPAVVARGVTAGHVPPPGGGSFVYGFNSLDTTQGAVGLFCNLVDFAPMDKGGSVRGCLKRGLSGGATGFSPMLFIGLGGASVNDKGYLLGLSASEPAHIILRKGTISAGLADLVPDPPVNGVLRRSTDTFVRDTWLHLRLDMIYNTNGDVRLQVFRSNLSTNPLSGAPNWQPVPGMSEFVDDALGVNSGSTPLTSGRAGFAFYTADVTRRGYVDHLEVHRQL